MAKCLIVIALAVYFIGGFIAGWAWKEYYGCRKRSSLCP